MVRYSGTFLDDLPGRGLLGVEDDRLLALVQLRLPDHHHHRAVLRDARAELVDGRAQLGEHAATRGAGDDIGKVGDHVAL